MEGVISAVGFIGHGIFFTFQLLIFGLLIGLVLAIIASIIRYKKKRGFIVAIINRIISILRGTPLILQLAFIYYSTPGIFGFKLSIFAAGIITFGLNSFAYITEIFRSGIENLPKGQFEAAQTLQIPEYNMWKDIILPQVLKNILPAMLNEVITLLKETALIGTIGGIDIMRSAYLIAAERFTYFMPLTIAGIYYYIFVLIIEYMGKKLEKRVNR